ncbi:hypothetical protein E2C01_061254 [Portunus trituberculatus]|uniref:Uncharacterized protein n=1 Tax=Portunus trituberculatus TaxID=210409 RepID=A0A5B7HB61_PORTR|nr:hypothetical protein [Portunus trituberculatus]
MKNWINGDTMSPAQTLYNSTRCAHLEVLWRRLILSCIRLRSSSCKHSSAASGSVFCSSSNMAFCFLSFSRRSNRKVFPHPRQGILAGKCYTAEYPMSHRPPPYAVLL